MGLASKLAAAQGGPGLYPGSSLDHPGEAQVKPLQQDPASLLDERYQAYTKSLQAVLTEKALQVQKQSYFKNLADRWYYFDSSDTYPFMSQYKIPSGNGNPVHASESMLPSKPRMSIIVKNTGEEIYAGDTQDRLADAYAPRLEAMKNGPGTFKRGRVSENLFEDGEHTAKHAAIFDLTKEFLPSQSGRDWSPGFRTPTIDLVGQVPPNSSVGPSYQDSGYGVGTIMTLGMVAPFLHSSVFKVGLATLLFAAPAFAAPASIDPRERLKINLTVFGTTLAELLPGFLLTGAYQFGIWKLIAAGAAGIPQIDGQAQHRAFYQAIQSLSSVALFLTTYGWDWAETNPVAFNGLGMNGLTALFAFYYCQFHYHRHWLKNAHRLMPFLLLAVFAAALYPLGYGVWTFLVGWLIICLYPVLARLNVGMLTV